MENKINILFQQINLDYDTRNRFQNMILDKVKINEKNGSWTFVIHNPEILDINDYKHLVELSEHSFSNVKKVYIQIVSDTKDLKKLKDYYLYALDKCKDILLFSSIFNDSLLIDDLKIEITNQEEEKQLLQILPKLNYILSLGGFDTPLEYVLNTKNNNIKDAILSDLDNIKKDVVVPSVEPVVEKTVYNNNHTGNNNYRREKKDDNPNAIVGRTIKDTPTQIKNIVGEMDPITVEGYVFGVDYFESSKTDFKIITLKITDYSDSIYCKVFCRGEEDFNTKKKALKDGKWFIIRGYTKNDQFSKELVLNARDINIVSKETSKIEDNAPVKRVELHAHTMMSQMDGVTKLDLGKHTCELVERTIQMGYRGVAITDHSGCQAFPISFGIIKSHNKGIRKKIKESIEELEAKISEETEESVKIELTNELEKKKEELKNPPIFKGLYGTELTLVDDVVNIVVRPTDDDLLHNTYVVFDTETTGFNAGGADQMIEIGAVKIKDGEIIGRFDELIDPKRHIPDKITELTCITDDMVRGKKSEEEVTKMFLEWTGNLPMVAHNAKFDISFIEMAMRKYNLGEFQNTVIDTLELSRTLDQGFSRHSLSALVKRYDVPWEEDAHHRADYDAEGTAYVFSKMLKKLEMQKFEKISDLEKLVSKDEIYKFGRTFHFNAIALNQVGLKNLFKIISLANTTYLYKTPRILRSKLNELREGLLIGSGCYESEVFTEARSKEGEELTNVISFYDYVEVQPPEVYDHLLQMGDFKDDIELKNHLTKIINATTDAGKIIVATGDVHHFERGDKIYREIIVNQKVPGGGRHPLAKKDITSIPSQHFRTTEEMLNDFSFLDKDLAYKIVVENTNKVLDMVDEIEVIPDTGGTPFSPRVKSDDEKSYLDCPRVVTDLVYTKANDWYGDPLPYSIEERLGTELYGDIVLTSIKYDLKDLDGEELKNFDFKCQEFENIELEKNNLLVANFSIPFCNKKYFNEFWNKISDSILKGRIFYWKFLWSERFLGKHKRANGIFIKRASIRII